MTQAWSIRAANPLVIVIDFWLSKRLTQVNSMMFNFLGHCWELLDRETVKGQDVSQELPAYCHHQWEDPSTEWSSRKKTEDMEQK